MYEHAYMHVNKLRKHENLKDTILTFSCFRIFFPTVIFLPNKKREQREWSVLSEFRVGRKSNIFFFLITCAKSSKYLWVGSSSLNRIALHGIPSCHCRCRARSGVTGCYGRPRLFPSYAFSYVLKYYVLVNTYSELIWIY